MHADLRHYVLGDVDVAHARIAFRALQPNPLGAGATHRLSDAHHVCLEVDIGSTKRHDLGVAEPSPRCEQHESAPLRPDGLEDRCKLAARRNVLVTP